MLVMKQQNFDKDCQSLWNNGQVNNVFQDNFAPNFWTNKTDWTPAVTGIT